MSMTPTALAAPGFWVHAQHRPGQAAIVEAGGTEITFGALGAEVNRLTHGLRSLGLSPGDGVAVVLPNQVAFLQIYLACMQAGLYITPVNFHLTGAEIAYIVADCEAKVLIGSERFASACSAAADELDFSFERRLAVGSIPGWRPLAEVTRDQPATTPDKRVAGQLMLYTSGTTGRPKGVRRPLPQGAPEVAAAVVGAFGTTFEISPEPGVHLTAGPLYHAAPLNFAAGSLHLGHTVVLMDRWSPAETLELIEHYRVTHTHMVPTMFHRLLALDEVTRKRADVSSLQTVIHAAAPCPVEVKRRMFEWWGPIIWEYYGATEGGGTLVRPQEWLEHPGTVGRVIPGSEIRILDEQGDECPPGVPGVVYLKPATTGNFEYFKDPAKTEANRKGHLFTVGDVGYFDEAGWLFLCDRASDMIISGGVNIYPAEVEALLLSHPAVADVAVLGVPDEEWGESVKAVVQPMPGAEPGDELEAELIAWCHSRVAGYKCPRSVDFRATLPRYDTGKLYKRLLREEYWKGRERKI